MPTLEKRRIREDMTPLKFLNKYGVERELYFEKCREFVDGREWSIQMVSADNTLLINESVEMRESEREFRL